MRMMMTVSLPTESANAAIADGTLATTTQKILAETKPEAAYFVAQNGVRRVYLFVNITDSNQIVGLAEPWFLSYNASVDFTPAMTPQDLGAAAPALENAVKNYAKK